MLGYRFARHEIRAQADPCPSSCLTSKKPTRLFYNLVAKYLTLNSQLFFFPCCFLQYVTHQTGCASPATRRLLEASSSVSRA
jgi:hypothetical protein